MKLYKYRRILGVIAVGAIATVSIGANISPNKKIIHEDFYMIKPGDNLWDIASKYCSDEDDILEVMYDIKKDNPHINIDCLKVGDEIVIKKEIADLSKSTNSFR